MFNVSLINILLEYIDGVESFPKDAKYAIVNPKIPKDYKKESENENFYFLMLVSKIKIHGFFL